MPRFALNAVAAAMGAAVLAGGPAPRGTFAQDAFDLSVPKPDATMEEELNLECATDNITGSGPGFTADRDQAEEVAIKDWTQKAQEVFPEADFDTAKDSNLSCAVQGLYAKCFADGIPCKPKVD